MLHERVRKHLGVNKGTRARNAAVQVPVPLGARLVQHLLRCQLRGEEIEVRAEPVQHRVREDARPEKAKPVGMVSYTTVRPEGLRNDLLFNFDLYVPQDFQPVNQDGEVAEFMLWEIDEVIQRLCDTEDFKFNSALVIIDFLIRHGFIEADDPNYPDIVAGLHR